MENKQNYCAIDIEFNQQEDQAGNKTSRIIQLGACIGNVVTGAIFEKKRWYVRIDEQLNPRIANLTGITQEQLNTLGVPLEQAYRELSSLHRYYDCHRNALEWRAGDSTRLRLELGLDEDTFLFGRYWLDIKPAFMLYCLSRDLDVKSGLAKSLTKIGLKFEGKKHDGCSDAVNTFRMAHKLVEVMREDDRTIGTKSDGVPS